MEIAAIVHRIKTAKGIKPMSAVGTTTNPRPGRDQFEPSCRGPHSCPPMRHRTALRWWINEDPRREACENRKGDSSPAVDLWVTRSSITPQRDGPQAGSLGTAQRGQITLQGTKPHESRPKVERSSAR